jgi:two-component system response regulator FixJ
MGEESRRVVSIVDDDASLRRSLRNLLSSAGLPVETFESAEVFLESASRNTTGCLVLEVRMPGIGGFGLLRRLVASGSRIPVIIMTAHGDEATRQRALNAGAEAFMEKPVQGTAFVDAIRSALAAV